MCQLKILNLHFCFLKFFHKKNPEKSLKTVIKKYFDHVREKRINTKIIKG